MSTKSKELSELGSILSVSGNTANIDGSVIVSNTITIGNSTVNATFSATSVNANTVGGNTALDLRNYTDNKAANAYSNAVTYTDNKVANLVNSAPAALDTLIELSNALGNDANFYVTVTNSIGNAYSNATLYADNKAANAYSNGVTYTDNKAANAYSNATLYADVVAGTAYSNGVTYTDNKAANAYSNAVTYADNKAANAYSNAVTYVDNKAANAYTNATTFASNASNITTGTLTANVLPTSGVTANTYGNSSQIPVITIDATGRITSATVNAVAGVTSFTYTEANNTFAISTGDGSTFTANIGTANATHTGVIKVLDSVANSNTTIAASVSAVKTAYDAAIAANTSAASAYSNAVTYADNKAANAYSNAVSYAATIAGTAYSNGVTYTDNKAANAYSNATTFASNASNISSGTLAEARLPFRMDQNVRTNDTVSFGSMTITGNLTVSGTTVTVNAVNLVVDDNMIYLNEGASGANVHPDLGFAGAYNDGTYRHAGFFRDASDGVWKVFDQYLPEPDASPFIDTANASFRIANFQANVVTAASFSGNGASVTSVDAATVGGNTAGTLRSYSDSVAGTAYTNAVSVSSNSAATAYSNAVNYFTTNYTASDVLTKIKTVDGTGSGLDADTVDGYDASSFALKTDPEFTNDITTSSGQGRFGGWYVGTGYTGPAFEVGLSSGEAYALAFNRDTSSYLNMNFNATDFQFTGESSGFAHINTSFRAPIFYDSNDTAYYVDINSESRMNQVRFYNRIGIGNGYRPYLNTGDAGIWFSSSADTATWFTGLDGENFRFYYGANKFYFDTSANFYAYGSARAPIFYDYDNTAYYTDPSSDSRVARLLVSDAGNYIRIGNEGEGANASYARIRTNGSGALLLDAKDGQAMYLNWYSGSGPIYSESSANFPIYYDRSNSAYYVDPASGTNLAGTLTNNGGTTMTGGWNRNLYLASTFPVVVFNSNNTKYSGIGVDYSVTSGGFYFWVNGSSADISGTGTAAMNIDTGNFVTAAGSFRAPIFYDSGNTSFYVDPASTSNLNTLTLSDELRINSNWGAGSYNEQLVIYGTYPSMTYRSTTSDTGWLIHTQSDGGLTYYSIVGATTNNWTQRYTFLTNGEFRNGGAGGSLYWHAGNDGSGSGLDADLLDGLNSATAATASTIVARDGSGHIAANYIFGSYFNASAGNSENPTIGQIWTQSTGDNYLRKSTPAHVISQLGLWTSSNDGSGSGLDADLLDGYHEGGFAVSQRGAEITNNTQINDNGRRNGMYRVNNGVTSSPDSNRYYSLIQYGNESNVVGQLVSDFVTGETYIRGYNSTWSSWRKVWDSVNDGSGSGLDADLLDGSGWTSGQTVSFGSATFTVSGYPIAAFNNTNSANYGLVEFTQSGTHKAWIGMGGSGMSFGTGAAYAADGFSINADGSGAFTISNRGASKWIRLATGTEGTSNFYTLNVRDGDVIVNQDAISYSSMDNTPVVGSTTTNRLHVNGSIQLTNNNDAIVFGRGTATFLKDEELGFGWGGGWYMEDSTWVRVRNNKNIYGGSGTIRTDGDMRAPVFYDQSNTSFYVDAASTSRLTKIHRTNPIYSEYALYTNTTNNLVRTWDGVLVAGSDSAGAENYTVIETNVPQDQYMMGGFAIDWFENYSNTNNKTRIHITGGYWNPESNGGFIGFEYTSSNPNLSPTIQVGRNASNGKTVFILSHFNSSYNIIVARDLWLGYSTGAADYGDGWTISQVSSLAAYTNLDTVVARTVNTTGSTQSHYAASFIDTASTSYYLDPDSTTSLRTVGSWRSDSSTWDGEFNGKIQYHSSYWYFQAANGWYFRNSGGSNVTSIDSSGNISTNGSVSCAGVVSAGYVRVTGNRGIMGDYDTDGTASKVIWTIGASWPLANMYGLGYEYGSGYDHHLALRNNGTTYSRFGFAGGMSMSGTSTFTGPINVHAGSYEGLITFGSSSTWRCGIRQHDDGDAELRIWAANAGGMIFLATGYDGEPASISRPTAGLVVGPSNNVGIGNFSSSDPAYNLHVVGSAYCGSLILGGSSYFRPQTWIQFDSTYGLYWPNNYGAHLHANDLSTYGQLALRGSKNSYGGFYDQYSAVNGIMYDSGGNGGVYREANGRWYWYHNVGNNCMGVGTATTSSSYYMYVGGSIYSTANIVAASDARIKENVITVESALDKVNALRGVYYNRIDDEEKKRKIGVIAQEVEPVIPEVVTHDKENDRFGVDYGNLAGLFIEAFKEQTKIINDLKQKIEELESKLNK